MKTFIKNHPNIFYGAILALVCTLFWAYAEYQIYAMKRNAFVAGCVQGSHGEMNRFQCWTVYHSTGYN